MTKNVGNCTAKSTVGYENLRLFTLVHIQPGCENDPIEKAVAAFVAYESFGANTAVTVAARVKQRVHGA